MVKYRIKKFNKIILIASYCILFVLIAYLINQNRILTEKVNNYNNTSQGLIETLNKDDNLFTKFSRLLNFCSKFSKYQTNSNSSLEKMNKILKDSGCQIDSTRRTEYQQYETEYKENLKNIVNLGDEIKAIQDLIKLNITPTITSKTEFEQCNERLISCSQMIETYCPQNIPTPALVALNINESTTQCMEEIQSCKNYISKYCIAPRIGF